MKVFDDFSLRRIEIDTGSKEKERKKEYENSKGDKSQNQQENRKNGKEDLEFAQMYLKKSIETADTATLVIICYEWAKQNIKLAIEGIEKKNWDKRYEGVTRALKTFTLLLDVTDTSYDVGKQLATFYAFLIKKIHEADAKKDINLFKKIISWIDEVQRSWEKAREKVANEGGTLNTKG